MIRLLGHVKYNLLTEVTNQHTATFVIMHNDDVIMCYHIVHVLPNIIYCVEGPIL